ncbi:MBL fold metallo-hydrolase [candidate division KSB1 bacterium]
MKITVLGSGTFQPTPIRGCPGYLLEINHNKILLDAGSGCLRQLSRLSVMPGMLNYVLISHFHIDHTGDLLPLLFSRRNAASREEKDICIYGPPDFPGTFKTISAAFSRWISSDNYSILIQEYGGGTMNFNGWSLETLPMEHSLDSYGFRITAQKKTIAYSGDTGYCENLIRLCRNADLAVVECTFPDSKKTAGHMTPSEAGKAAQKAGCKRLILSHLSPELSDEEAITACSRYFSGMLSVAEELKPIDI